MWWTELSSPWARESTKLLNEEDREVNTSFVFVFLDKMLGKLTYLYSSCFRNIQYNVDKSCFFIT